MLSFPFFLHTQPTRLCTLSVVAEHSREVGEEEFMSLADATERHYEPFRTATTSNPETIRTRRQGRCRVNRDDE